MICKQCRGIGPHLQAREKSHGFYRVTAGTWGIFSSYSRDDPSKLVFVQRSQDSGLVTRDTSAISTRLGRAIRTHFEVRRETEGPFLVSTLILGFLSIFKKSQDSSTFEALNCVCLSRCQRDARTLSRLGGDLGLSLGPPHGIQTSLHLVR